MEQTQICCQYDGTFPGFLTCVFHCYTHRLEPVEFFLDEAESCSLYPAERIVTQREAAQRVYRSLEPRLGHDGAELVRLGFLTCLPQRELWLWTMLRLGYDRGPALFAEPHPIADRVRQAVQRLEAEASRLADSLCFSDRNGVLVQEIEPENRVLPLLRPRVSQKFPEECVLIYDRTHREALFHRPGCARILPVWDTVLGPRNDADPDFLQMWRCGYGAADRRPAAHWEKDRSRATHSVTACAAASISAGVVSSPSVSRMEP